MHSLRCLQKQVGAYAAKMCTCYLRAGPRRVAPAAHRRYVSTKCKYLFKYIMETDEPIRIHNSWHKTPKVQNRGHSWIQFNVVKSRRQFWPSRQLLKSESVVWHCPTTIISNAKVSEDGCLDIFYLKTVRWIWMKGIWIVFNQIIHKKLFYLSVNLLRVTLYRMKLLSFLFNQECVTEIQRVGISRSLTLWRIFKKK